MWFIAPQYYSWKLCLFFLWEPLKSLSFFIFPRDNVKHLNESGNLLILKHPVKFENINNWSFNYIFLNKLKDKEHNILHTLYFSYVVWNHTQFFSF